MDRTGAQKRRQPGRQEPRRRAARRESVVKTWRDLVTVGTRRLAGKQCAGPSPAQGCGIHREGARRRPPPAPPARKIDKSVRVLTSVCRETGGPSDLRLYSRGSRVSRIVRRRVGAPVEARSEFRRKSAFPLLRLRRSSSATPCAVCSSPQLSELFHSPND